MGSIRKNDTYDARKKGLGISLIQDMKVLIDTNIIIDFATNREPFAEQAQKIFE